MIKTQRSVPSVYYDKSRDFQLLGRTFDGAMNYLKTVLDTIQNNPFSDNVSDSLLDLSATTLGFKIRHKYKANQLRAICSTLSYCLKNKGTEKSIETAINALLQAEGVNSKCSLEMDHSSNTLIIYVSNELQDLNLFNDLLDYILPAGVSCQVVKVQLVEESISDIEVISEDKAFSSVLVNIIPVYSESNVGAMKDHKMLAADRDNIHEGRVENTTVQGYVKPDEIKNPIKKDGNIS